MRPVSHSPAEVARRAAERRLLRTLSLAFLLALLYAAPKLLSLLTP